MAFLNHVSDFRFLGEGEVRYRDSGMMGMPANERPDVFWQADIEIASNYLLSVIDEVKPQVLITYDEIGGYGHPDHIQAHRVAMRASEKSTWQIQKIYWNTMPKSVLADSMAKMKELGSDFFGADNVDDLPFAKDDSFVTTTGNKDNHYNDDEYGKVFYKWMDVTLMEIVQWILQLLLVINLLNH